MQGAGNDFVVLDATRQPLSLSHAQYRALADRHFGVGADQILVVEPSRTPDVDFGYRIFNASGDEVEHCGNGARCFVHYVRDQGLTDKRRIRVETVNRRIELQLRDDGRVTVDMGAPEFAHAAIPFDGQGLRPRAEGDFELWPLELIDGPVEVAVLSMGNPHAVQRVDDVERTDVATLGPEIEVLRRFPQKVNAGFMQVLSRSAHPAARVRARRRRDAGLRHRRLRRGGGRHPPGLAGQRGRGRHPRRALVHRLGRPGPTAADDRPGDDCFRRGDRTVTSIQGAAAGVQGITEHDIADVPVEHAGLLRAPRRGAGHGAADQPARPARGVAAGAADGDAARAHQGARAPHHGHDPQRRGQPRPGRPAAPVDDAPAADDGSRRPAAGAAGRSARAFHDPAGHAAPVGRGRGLCGAAFDAAGQRGRQGLRLQPVAALLRRQCRLRGDGVARRCRHA